MFEYLKLNGRINSYPNNIPNGNGGNLKREYYNLMISAMTPPRAIF